ncbi:MULTISPECIES: hypothetical protein [unclassified Rhizobium]|jgi:hypothetical protein|uniref:hypothetical protein n=1 Tax=unclassified Rhizobium TaxID=2613769 RepID=UPI001619878A|nr:MULTISPECIES: hypothetical protein [unclassified Rhizobium]MBB3541029.1 hypothetical protein [Rhizobium sp. BK399]MCS3741314.1 hypothetical protein [Rhizobium sp. BK661]MCS4093767.1 hypothetical protein [Rhizobium sp. BK176]
MDCVVIEHKSHARVSETSNWLSGLGRRLLRRFSEWDRLDLEGMPDRVKRDLGFLDGREPRFDREFWQ